MTNGIERYLDAAVLKPTDTPEEAIVGIDMCIRFKTRTVCVRPCDIPVAVERCKGTDTAVSCVLAFPHGTAQSASKTAEARLYVEQGVHEIDMVTNYGFILGGNWAGLLADIRSVTDVARPAGIPVKTIFETVNLNADQIRRATEIAVEAQADFVKTSTGFADGGASPEAVRAMLDAAKGRIKVKASGGIRNQEQARMYIDMGCLRLGIGYTSLQAICEGGETVNDAY